MIASIVFKKLLKNSLTIGFAESMTGGFCAYKMIENEGASHVIKGSIIAYSDDEKESLLHVSKETIEKYTSISKEVSIEMAKGIKNILNCDIAVAITGNASYKENTKDHISYVAIIKDDQIYDFKIDLKDLNRMESIEKTATMIYQKIDQILG